MGQRSKADREMLSDLSANMRMAKYLGMFPAELSGTRLAHSATGLACTFLMVLLVSANVLIQIFDPSYLMNSFSKADTLANVAVWICMNCTVISLPIVAVRRRRSLNLIISNLMAFKETFKKQNILWNPTRPYVLSSCFDIYLLFLMLFDLIYSVTELTDVSYTIAYYYNSILLNEAQSQFMWFALNIAEAYNCLRQSVDRVLSYKDFEYLIKFHLTLSECCQELNDAYSMQFLFSFATVSIVFLNGSFSMITGILHQIGRGEIFIYLFWVLNYLAMGFRLINACEFLKKEAKKFDDTIYEKIIQDQASNVLQPTAALSVFLHFLSNEPVTFTMFKFTEVNWGLLFSIVAGGITYLVFLIDADMN
ncbi:Gustatory receptor 151 [Halyomorpha halys]|nr:Gustatory receptor 151 [Halyomorpha halys]